MLENINPIMNSIAILVLGSFSALTLYNQYKKGNNSDTIFNFKNTIESMKLRMDEMDTELKETRKNHQESLEKIAHLKGENETLKSLLLGRDPESIQYRDKSLQILTLLVDEVKKLDGTLQHHLLSSKKPCDGKVD